MSDPTERIPIKLNLNLLNQSNRRVYLKDHVLGARVDTIARETWADLKIQLPFSWMTVQDMETITREVLVVGRYCGILIHDKDLAERKSLIAIDPDMLSIAPRPFKNCGPALRMWIPNPPDPWTQGILDTLAQEGSPLAAHFRSNIELNQMVPLGDAWTIFIARKASPYDFVGSSYLMGLKMDPKFDSKKYGKLRELILRGFENKPGPKVDTMV